MTKQLVIGLFTLLLTSCASQNHSDRDKKEQVFVDFAFERSYETYLDRDSVLQTIPDTMGFIVSSFGDTMDLKLREAILREHKEWLKFYKNPTIISQKKEGKTLTVQVEFTGGGAYVFDGSASIVEDSLFLYYCDIGREKIPHQDTRYILTYTLNAKKAKSKPIGIHYKKPLPRVQKTN